MIRVLHSFELFDLEMPTQYSGQTPMIIHRDMRRLVEGRQAIVRYDDGGAAAGLQHAMDTPQKHLASRNVFENL